MGFFKRLFGGGNKKDKPYVDENGIYLYVQCERCQTIIKLRADKKHDLNKEDGQLSWHKTIVCPKCFQRGKTVAFFDRHYEMVNHEIMGMAYVAEADFEAQEYAKLHPHAEEEE